MLPTNSTSTHTQTATPFVDPTGQTATWDTIINGVVLGVTVIAAVASGGLLGAALYAGAVSSWLAFGISMTALAADLTSSAIAAAQIHNDRKDVTDFISDTNSDILTWAGTILGITSGLTIGFSAAIAAKASTALGSTTNTSLKTAKATGSLMEDNGKIIAREIVPGMTGENAARAINHTVKSKPQYVGWFKGAQGTEFLFVHPQGQPARMGIGRPLQKQIIISPHESLAKLMGLQVPPRQDEASILLRTHISGGILTPVYRAKNGNLRMQVYTHSGHFAGDKPEVFWSPQVRKEFSDYMEQRGIEVKIREHDDFSTRQRSNRDPLGRPTQKAIRDGLW
jgi:hypothetical protein